MQYIRIKAWPCDTVTMGTFNLYQKSRQDVTRTNDRTIQHLTVNRVCYALKTGTPYAPMKHPTLP
ncbi:hypothetical protein SOVF_004210 [Spinacia oleracea]|nr:hypothetical protein SOVF_004210 [Spinacia oleracea]